MKLDASQEFSFGVAKLVSRLVSAEQVLLLHQQAKHNNQESKRGS
jgi:hypothetical protein